MLQTVVDCVGCQVLLGLNSVKDWMIDYIENDLPLCRTCALDHKLYCIIVIISVWCGGKIEVSC